MEVGEGCLTQCARATTNMHKKGVAFYECDTAEHNAATAQNNRHACTDRRGTQGGTLKRTCNKFYTWNITATIQNNMCKGIIPCNKYQTATLLNYFYKRINMDEIQKTADINKR